MSIEPGIYASGNPTSESPVIVTANYDYTYIKVMRDLKGSDTWVLCLDSRGINVWCAARGDDFGNKQILEAVKATGIQNYTNKKTLILPQLSAASGVVVRIPGRTGFVHCLLVCVCKHQNRGGSNLLYNDRDKPLLIKIQSHFTHLHQSSHNNEKDITKNYS